jgi:hypothetical protein
VSNKVLIHSAAYVLQAMAAAYWANLRRPGSLYTALAAATASARSGMQSGFFIDRIKLTPGIVAGISVGVVLLCITAAALAAYAWYALKGYRGLPGRVLAPGIGPGTTLVVTDIQVWTRGRCRCHSY